ncbi:hypothetical protein ECDEC2C_1431 [Escherichia coli DEC2C]|nr:hypothetical protein ECDEC2C_1431 [Escherichia coli DEC2C]
MISDELRAANSAGAIATGLLALKIPVPLTTVQWADRHYYLPKESSYTPGRWETLPFQVAIMNSMGNDRIRTVNLIKSARVGYTKMLLGVEAYFIEHKSRNSLLFQPTDSAAEDFMKSHVEPTIRDVPVLLDLAPWFGRKHRDNTLTLKRFSSGRRFLVPGRALPPKTTVKNPWTWSAMTNFPRSSRMSKKRARQPCWGISVLRGRCGQNPFAARRLKSKAPARSKKRPTSRRISCVFMCPARTVGRRSI